VLKIAQYCSFQCAAHLKNTTIFSNIKIVFFPANCMSQLEPAYLGIIHVFKCHYREQVIQKTVAITDGGLLQDATHMKLDVLSAMHFNAEAWRFVTHIAIKNRFVRCGFSTDHASSNDGNEVKLSEDEEVDWHSLQPLGVKSEEYTCDSALEVCGVQNVDQVLDQHLTRPEEEPEEEEKVAEHKATILDALHGLETARNYISQFDTKHIIFIM
jgi:hypothetical protein